MPRREKKAPWQVKEASLEEIRKRMERSLAFNTSGKIQCGHISESEVYQEYLANFTIGLALTTILDTHLTVKRLTDRTHKELDQLLQTNYNYSHDYGYCVRPEAGVRKIVTKEENYYTKPVKYVLFRRINKIGVAALLRILVSSDCANLILQY